MSLRDRLLALLRQPGYQPANEFEIARRLDLKKRDRASLAHEVRVVLKGGEFARAGNGRIAPRSASGGSAGAGAPEPRRAEARPVFTPSTRRLKMPPPEDKSPSWLPTPEAAHIDPSRASGQGQGRSSGKGRNAGQGRAARQESQSPTGQQGGSTSSGRGRDSSQGRASDQGRGSNEGRPSAQGGGSSDQGRTSKQGRVSLQGRTAKPVPDRAPDQGRSSGQGRASKQDRSGGQDRSSEQGRVAGQSRPAHQGRAATPDRAPREDRRNQPAKGKKEKAKFIPVSSAPTPAPAPAPAPTFAPSGGRKQQAPQKQKGGRKTPPTVADYIPVSELAPSTRTPTSARTPAPAPASAPTPASDSPAASPAAPAPKLRAGELIGRIQFRNGGSAFIVREAIAGVPSDEPALQVFPEDTGVALPGDRVIAREFPGRKGRRVGEKVGGVVRVLERTRDTIVGDLRTGRRGFVVQPDDPRFSYEIQVSDPAKSGVSPAPKPGDKVVVQLGEWVRRESPLTGTIVSRLGRTHEPSAELLGIFIKYDLAREFPADVEREAAAIPNQVQPAELEHRLDYRDKAVFTIDPDDAKDFDDALSYEELFGGEIRIGIHIADVSTYVHPGSALDREAQRRGNSTYLVGVVIPMLPEKLSNGLCSLVEAQDRLCKAVFLTFDKKLKLKETTYANTVIRSRKRLTYKQAYAFIFENDIERIRALPLPPKHQTGSTGRALRDLSDNELIDLQTWIRALWKIAAKLRKDRMAHGSLDLDMPETKIFVDEQGYADRLEKIHHDESHQLIEEFMLAANEAVARLTRTYKLPSLYRVHDDPDAEKLEELRGVLDTYEIRVGDLTQRAELVKLLEILNKHPQGYTLRTQLLRSLKKAVYRHTPDGHFGLAKKDYTHFTSPIRRYSDLVVHRVFDHYLVKHAGLSAPGGQGPGYDLQRVTRMGEHLSLTEVNSAEAERDSVKVKLLEFFEREIDKKPKTKFQAIITDVRANGFFIELTESMTFGFVSASALRDDYYSLNTSGDALVGRKRKRRFETNQRLDVVVEKVDRYKRLIDFIPV